MEKKQVINFMQRIKSHYQEFVIDDFKIDEWYKELKDYSEADVNAKLDNHLNSEEYGSQIPKVHFLTKYLKKEQDKEKEIKGSIQCTICHKFINKDEYERHYDRCSSVDYLNRRNIDYFNKSIDKDKYMTMEQREFDDKYNKMAYYIFENTKSPMEKYCLEQYLMGLHKNQENIDF